MIFTNPSGIFLLLTSLHELIVSMDLKPCVDRITVPWCHRHRRTNVTVVTSELAFQRLLSVLPRQTFARQDFVIEIRLKLSSVVPWRLCSHYFVLLLSEHGSVNHINHSKLFLMGQFRNDDGSNPPFSYSGGQLQRFLIQGCFHCWVIYQFLLWSIH